MHNYAFIDAQNLNLSIQDQGWKLDLKKFRVFLKDKYKVAKAYIFIGYMPENETLYTLLQEHGYIIIFKPISKDGQGKVKGNVDAELVLHTLVEIPNYHKAIITTGDGDFHCLLEHLEKVDKLEKLLIPNKEKYSKLLKRFVTKAAFLTEQRKKLEYIKK